MIKFGLIVENDNKLIVLDIFYREKGYEVIHITVLVTWWLQLALGSLPTHGGF